MEEKHRKLKKRWIVLIVVAVLLVALAGCGFAVAKGYLAQIGRTYDEPADTIAPEDEFFDVDFTDEPAANPTPSADPAPSASAAPVNPQPSEGNPPEEAIDTVISPNDVQWPFIKKIEDDHLINILLVGQDKYPGTESTKRQRSDSMILCSINPQTGEVALISFLRDLYVQIPGDYSDNRLNVPYVYGGFKLLDETLTLNFGVSVDANFEVDMASFEAIVDMVGGVDLELTAAEAKHMREVCGLNVVEGMNHLSGREARVFAQIRKIDNDFGRTTRQREVLLAIFEKVKHLSISQMLDLLYNALPYLTTDMTDSEILSLAYRLLPLMSTLDIETYSVPSKGTYQAASVRGMAVLMPDLEAIRDKLENEYLPLN